MEKRLWLAGLGLRERNTGNGLGNWVVKRVEAETNCTCQRLSLDVEQIEQRSFIEMFVCSFM